MFHKKFSFNFTNRSLKVPVFVVDWPSSCKPFYARVRDGDPDTVSALDLLLPDVGEVAGGSLREHR